METFLKHRAIHSCPASRMVSVDTPRYSVDTPRILEDKELSAPWPATRGPSLEEDKETAFEWPATRGPSLEEERDTFHAWPATRGPSMEDARVHDVFDGTVEEDEIDYRPNIQWTAAQAPVMEAYQASQSAAEMYGPFPMTWGGLQDFSMPNHGTAMMSTVPEHYNCNFQEADEDPLSAFLAPDNAAWDMIMKALADRKTSAGSSSDPQACRPEKMNPSLEQFMKVKSENIASGVQDSSPCDTSTAASSVDGDRVRELLNPPPVFDDMLDADATKGQEISLASALGAWSIGTTEHSAGTCKPCGFYWKGNGCQKAEKCGFCHLCPEGEVKRRKKAKHAALYTGVVRSAQNEAAGDWDAAQFTLSEP